MSSDLSSDLQILQTWLHRVLEDREDDSAFHNWLPDGDRGLGKYYLGQVNILKDILGKIECILIDKKAGVKELKMQIESSN